MNQALHIGPLALPPGLLHLLATAAAAWLAARWATRAGGWAAAEPVFVHTLLVALLAARLTFVLDFRDAYLAAPWQLIDIRDGGWHPQAGLIAAWLYALSRLRRAATLRSPVLAALSSATVVWVIGAIGLALTGPTGQALPTSLARSLDGQAVRLDHFAGRPTVINLWATWCPPCRREMPVLADAQRRYPGVNIVLLNQGESPVAVQQYLARSGLTLDTVLLDTNREVARSFGQSALPTTLFFGADGRLVSVRIGELSQATLGQRLRGLTGAETPAPP